MELRVFEFELAHECFIVVVVIIIAFSIVCSTRLLLGLLGEECEEFLFECRVLSPQIVVLFHEIRGDPI